MSKNPEVYKNKIDNLKTKVQDKFYYHANDKYENNDEVSVKPSKTDLLMKIDNIFKRNDYVYKTDVIIMYKNGENIEKKIVGIKDNYLITLDSEKISIDDIYDIK